MNSNRLVLLDTVVGFLLLPLCLLMRFSHQTFRLVFRPRYRGVLVIKFLGAGNFLAIKSTLENLPVDILTAKENKKALEAFGIGDHIFTVDKKNLISLFVSSLHILRILIFSRYEQVINLETESKFAKFLTASTSARTLSGVSNVNKSYLDLWLYDRYLVNPAALDKGEIVSLLLKFSEFSNKNIAASISSHQARFFKNDCFQNIKRVVIAPSCSNTDQLRRLSIVFWEKIISHLVDSRVEHIDIFFSDEHDLQYQEFFHLSARVQACNLQITSYDDFINSIKLCDLLLTVDSQALHVAQVYQRPTIAFYGPTSPFGVNLGPNTYPITRTLSCSPCTHKYLNLPCGGRAPCMNFSSDDFDILCRINM